MTCFGWNRARKVCRKRPEEVEQDGVALAASRGCPGLTTLRITSSPSSVVARWIWPIDAEPMRIGSIQENIESTGRSRSFSMISGRRSKGTTGRRSSRFLSSSVIDGRQDVLAQGQDLAELDVGRPEDLQAPAELHRERLARRISLSRNGRANQAASRASRKARGNGACRPLTQACQAAEDQAERCFCVTKKRRTRPGGGVSTSRAKVADVGPIPGRPVRLAEQRPAGSPEARQSSRAPLALVTGCGRTARGSTPSRATRSPTPSEISPASTTPATISASLLTLPLPAAAEDLQALALGRRGRCRRRGWPRSATGW